MSEITALLGIELTGAIATGAFIVSLIIQLIKDLPLLKKVPTQLVVIILSIIISEIAYGSFTAINHTTAQWYMVIAAMLAGFIIAYIAMYGFDNLKKLWDRFHS